VQPAPGQFGLEDEPALWMDLHPRAALPAQTAATSTSTFPAGLPNTSPGAGWLIPFGPVPAVVGGAIGLLLVWVLRRRATRLSEGMSGIS
jgi:hypothetical protein